MENDKITFLILSTHLNKSKDSDVREKSYSNCLLNRSLFFFQWKALSFFLGGGGTFRDKHIFNLEFLLCKKLLKLSLVKSKSLLRTNLIHPPYNKLLFGVIFYILCNISLIQIFWFTWLPFYFFQEKLIKFETWIIFSLRLNNFFLIRDKVYGF